MGPINSTIGSEREVGRPGSVELATLDGFDLD
jgi:hypothetical protein